VFVEDTGNALLVTADVPGLSHKDIDLELDKGTLKISGERKVSAPEGYAVHRQERGSMKFSRSFTLPALIDPEKVSATVKDGVLTVNLEKSAAAKPRQIAVKSA
jgi:HSP20 family protein